MRINLGVGFAFIVASILLFGAKRYEGAAGCFVPGILFTLAGARQLVKLEAVNVDQDRLAIRWKEVVDRLERGETPRQIAEAFESKYQIVPTRTLLFIARQSLILLARTDDPEAVKELAAALSSGREENPAPARDLITKFDGRRNVLGLTWAVQAIGPQSGTGGLVAALNYLYFFEIESEDLGKEMVKEKVLGSIPGLHYAMLGETLMKNAAAELEDPYAPKELEELSEAFHSPNSFAVSWRDVIWVGKRPATGPIRTPRLVLRHRSGADVVERSFEFNYGFSLTHADAWIEVVRAACALDGNLLPADSAAHA